MFKKKLFFTVISVLSLSLYGQNFPGNDIDLIDNKEIKVLPVAESLKQYGYKGFYKDSKLKKKFACCESYNSKYDELVNKVFLVKSISANESRSDKFILNLFNESTGLIYYDYDSKSEYSFPFEVVGGIDFPEGFFCKDITETKDKFQDKITLRSPLLEPISFTRSIEGSSDNIYMRVSVVGSTINVGIKGLILLLENGEKLEWPNTEISSKVNRNGRGYDYSAFVSLNKEEILKLKDNIISDVKLYIYDASIEEGKKYEEYLNCIINKNNLN